MGLLWQGLCVCDNEYDRRGEGLALNEGGASDCGDTAEHPMPVCASEEWAEGACGYANAVFRADPGPIGNHCQWAAPDRLLRWLLSGWPTRPAEQSPGELPVPALKELMGMHHIKFGTCHCRRPLRRSVRARPPPRTGLLCPAPRPEAEERG